MNKKIIILILVLGVLVASFFVFSNKFSDSSKTNIAKTEDVEKIEINALDEVVLVEEYVKNNIAKLTIEKPVLGGTFYITKIDVDVSNKKVVVGYEDGHIADKVELNYEIKNGEVVISAKETSFSEGDFVASTAILAYHTIAPLTGKETAEQKRYKVSPDVLEKQFIYLKEKGYTVIPLDDLVTFLETGSPILPEKSIVLTFDDGLDSQYENAVPLLQKYEYPATFFVYTLTVGKNKFMTWDQVKEVMDKGITIGSHTKTHAFLTKTEDKEVLMDELAGSKKIIEESIGRSVDFLAYPFYMQNEHVQDFVKRAGYRSALAGWKKETPSTETLFALKRNEVTNDMKMFPSFLK